MGGRGEMTPLNEQEKILGYIKESIQEGARKTKVCDFLQIPIRTVQRWENKPEGDKRPQAKHISPISLTEAEKDEIVEICSKDEYKDMNPNEIVPILAQNGKYIASESTFYRVLRERGLLKNRSNSKPGTPRNAPDELKATEPNQVWSWDITYLKTTINGIFFYLYFFMDVWSRKITGWTVEYKEDGKIASRKISEICKENKIKKDNTNLHSDNGPAMKSGTMLATLAHLGVVPSFSRARVSNDNAYSELLFKTLKYVPEYPKQFNSIEDARKWVEKFVYWYNNEHHHSGIDYVTPEERHSGKDKKLLEKRKETYRKAKQANPKRWSGKIKNLDYKKEVILNKKKDIIKLNKAAD